MTAPKPPYTKKIEQKDTKEMEKEMAKVTVKKVKKEKKK